MTNNDKAIKMLDDWARRRRSRWWEVMRHKPRDYTVGLGQHDTREQIEGEGHDILAAATKALEAWSQRSAKP